MPQSYAALYAHFVFSTKDRALMIESDWKQSLYDYIGGICKNNDCVLIAAGGIADHIHLLVSVSREISSAELMKDVKASSSAWVHEKTPCAKFAWQNGYSVFSVSHSNLPAVREYLERQEEHHRKLSFQDELLALLRKHNVEFDERYIWK